MAPEDRVNMEGFGSEFQNMSAKFQNWETNLENDRGFYRYQKTLMLYLIGHSNVSLAKDELKWFNLNSDPNEQETEVGGLAEYVLPTSNVNAFDYPSSLTYFSPDMYFNKEAGEGVSVPYVLYGMENTPQAIKHYFNGDGSSVTLGNNTIKSLILSKDFQQKHRRIISGKTTSLTGSFSVDLTWTVYHVGKTNVNYSILVEERNCTVTYELFANDGFWDVDRIDEYFGGLFQEPIFQPDGLGPNLERMGGTPYMYVPVIGTYTFPNPGY